MSVDYNESQIKDYREPGLLGKIGIVLALVTILGLIGYAVFSKASKPYASDEDMIRVKELQHRIEVCNKNIDNINFTAYQAEFQCGMMWILAMDLGQYFDLKHVETPEIVSTLETAKRTILRYHEYKTVLDTPIYRAP